MSSTSCILTIIKNEHLYLDEWIKYHLDLGIDHIFIFEDIDSDSHKEICDKYGDKVSLNNVGIVLNKEDLNKAKELKITKKWNAQHLYFRNAIIYVKNTSKYDWCFIIDNDEFITLSDNKTLTSVLQLYENYDAFLIQWKCYGANGHIKKPNYQNKGLIETYTKEISGKLPDKLDSLVKTCYNLKTYNNSFFYNQHHPNNNCNWCNTDFKKDVHAPIYTNVYIRHYVTKSWEEYVWKRKTRGFMWGGTRSLDAFFEINADMLSMKDKLMSQIKDDVLVVMPYKQSGSQGNEIKLTLNGWRKFCQFKYRFVVIGEFDESLEKEFPWVKFINCPTKDKKEGQYNPHLDIMNKFKVISRLYAQEYDGFIYITDDEYAIKPFELNDVTRIYYHSSSFNGRQDQPTSYWNHDKWKTRKLLDRENLPHINYTTHHPCYFEFKKLKEIREKYNMLEESYVFDDVYFNYFKHEEPILDSTIRLGIWNKGIFERDFKRAVDDPNIKFVCNSVEGWSEDLETSLSEIVQPLTNGNMVLDYLRNNEIKKLQIGCGPNLLNGWLNTDASSKRVNENVMFMDAGRRFPIPSHTFDYVFSEHLFEHLTYEQAKNMLDECYRILKPNGVIRIATPNLRFLLDLYLNPQKEINKSYIEFDARRSGLPPHPIFAINRFHTTWGHKIIYDEESLTMMLENANFKNIHQCEIGKSEYSDLCMVERHYESFERQKADKDYNALQTMVFEAER